MKLQSLRKGLVTAAAACVLATPVWADSVTTAGNQTVNMPTGITVFNAEQVETPQGTVDLMKRIRESVNKSLSTAQMQVTPSLTAQQVKNAIAGVDKAQKVIDTLNIYQLQGITNEGHTTAMVYTLKDTSATGQPKDIGGATNAKELQKQLDTFNRISDGLVGSFLQRSATYDPQSMKEQQDLLSKYYDAMGKDVSYDISEYSPSKKVQSNVGPVYISTVRVTKIKDGLYSPVALIVLQQQTNTGRVITVVDTNQHDYAYWYNVVKTAWGIQ